nr:uncharacterized protein LOC117279279 [Nicotiana tomentosiformis]
MAKTSKIVPQKESVSSSRPAGDKTPVEPRPEECVPGGCVLTSYFKIDKGLSVPGRSEPVLSGCLDVGTVPNLKSWVRDLASTSTYAERSWRDLSKGRWEAKNHGLGKDAVMRPPSGEEKILAPVPKPAKDNKRKRASTFEDPTLKTKTARKLKKNNIPLTEESVRRLRDENEEEEENDGSILVARVKKTIDAPKAAGSMVFHEAPSRAEGMSEKDSGKVFESLKIDDASHRSQQMVGISEGVSPEALRTEENSPSDSLREIVLTLHQEELSKYRTELSRREADF